MLGRQLRYHIRVQLLRTGRYPLCAGGILEDMKHQLQCQGGVAGASTQCRHTQQRIQQDRCELGMPGHIQRLQETVLRQRAIALGDQTLAELVQRVGQAALLADLAPNRDTHLKTALCCWPIPMGLSGLAYLAQGWVIGAEGFSDANSAPTLIGIVATLTWSIWLLISAWRMRQAVAASG